MSAPALTQYITGQGSVGGDQLNTFLQTADNFAQLRAFVGTTGMQVYARGTVAPGDGGQGNFYWNTNAVGPDDNYTVIIPPGAASGGWVRLVENTAGFFGAADTGTLNALAVSLPEALASIPIYSIIIVDPLHTTTITNPTLSVNGATPVTITSPLGAALSVGAITLGNPAQIMVGTGHALWLLNPGGSSLGPYATAALGELPGTATNDNASAGNIGEFLTQSGSGVGLTTGVTANVATLSLTAGDWDVWGMIEFAPALTTTVDEIAAGVSTTSASFGAPSPTALSFSIVAGSLTTGGTQGLATGQIRVSIAVTTNVYLVATSDFSVSTMNTNGFIAARRVR